MIESFQGSSMHTDESVINDFKRRDRQVSEPIRIGGVTNISSGEDPDGFFTALGKVFVLPTIPQLSSDEGMKDFLSNFNGENGPWGTQGPSVEYDDKGRPSRIFTFTSGRGIYLEYTTDTPDSRQLQRVRVEFGKKPSITAAGELIAHLREEDIPADIYTFLGMGSMTPDEYPGPVHPCLGRLYHDMQFCKDNPKLLAAVLLQEKELEDSMR